jgi:hypothetical protein
MSQVPTLTPEQRAELEAWENRRLSPEEFAARVAAPWTEHEHEDFAALLDWFNRRYPTPLERLRATRHLAAQWQRSHPG